MDHYLPKEKFPRLAYCMDNLLPSCDACNTIKRDYSPPDLPPDSVVDPALAGRVYVPEEVLSSLAERLVEPCVDEPSTHLQFDPVHHAYRGLTTVGETTRIRMFPDERAADLARLSDHVACIVETGPGHEEMLETLVGLVGRRFYVEAYAAFWRTVFLP